MMASGAWQKNFLWDAKTGERIATLKEEKFGPTMVTFSPDGRTLASWSLGDFGIGTIRLWDVDTRKRLITIKSEGTSKINSVRFSLDGRRLIAIHGKTEIRIWDAKIGKHLNTLSGHQQHLCCYDLTAWRNDCKYRGQIKLFGFGTLEQDDLIPN